MFTKKRFYALLVLLVVMAIGSYLYYKKSTTKIAESPSIPMISNEQNNWQQETVEEIGLTFQHPIDLVFHKEVANDGDAIRTVGFYVTKGSEDSPEYQLYGLFQQFKNATEQDIELAKQEMDATTVQETRIDGYSGIEGLITGQRTRFSIVVIKDGKLFSVSTMPPTQENKELTDHILTTFEFE